MKRVKELYEIIRALAALLGRIADHVCEHVGDFLGSHTRLGLIMAAACYLIACAI